MNNTSADSTLINRNSENKHDNHIDNPHSYVRKRTRATAEQLAVLEDTFAVNVSPNSKLRKQLAEQLNMSERSIQIWFQNRRAKVKHMQKRAQMQMQQAAIRAQLYHYHQQQFGMLSPYGAAPPATHPMLPLQPPSLYSQQGQPQSAAAAVAAAAAAAVASQQQQNPQQGFFFPPPPYMRRMPVPRAQSVDAVSYYGHPAGQVAGQTSNTTTPDLAARSSFPTPGPEPFLPDTSATPPPPHMSQHYTMAAAAVAAAGGSWSVPPPNYSILDNSTSNNMKLTRQSMPPYNPLSHTLMDDFVGSTPTTTHTGSGTPGAQQSHEFITGDGDKNLTDDFPDFVHGQMSPSPSPNREEKNASYFSVNDATATATHSSTTDTSTTNKADASKMDDKTVKTENSTTASGAAGTTTMNEADMWIASPNINTTLNTTGLSNNEDESGAHGTVNPSNLMMAGSSSSTPPFENPTQCSHLSATTLTIGTWHRLKLQSSDLVCLYEHVQNAFMWYITEGGCRFKVEIPLTTLVSIEHSTSMMSVSGEPTSDIHLYMSQPPLFYMETTANNSNNAATENNNSSSSSTNTASNTNATSTTTTASEKETISTTTQWIQCSDFTENKQASRFLRHTLKGGSLQLKQELLHLINEKEEVRKFVHFLDDTDANNTQSSNHFNHTTIPSSTTNVFDTTPFLPSQQQQHQQSTLMLPPSAAAVAAVSAGATNPYYPDSTYYCYPGMPTTANMPPLPLPTTSSTTTTMVSSNESPVPCGGFYP